MKMCTTGYRVTFQYRLSRHLADYSLLTHLLHVPLLGGLLLNLPCSPVGYLELPIAMSTKIWVCWVSGHPVDLLQGFGEHFGPILWPIFAETPESCIKARLGQFPDRFWYWKIIHVLKCGFDIYNIYLMGT